MEVSTIFQVKQLHFTTLQLAFIFNLLHNLIRLKTTLLLSLSFLVGSWLMPPNAGISYRQQDDTSYFIAPDGRALLFVQHPGHDLTLTPSEHWLLSHDLQQQKIELHDTLTAHRTLFTTDPKLVFSEGYDAIYLVAALGHATADNAIYDSDTPISLSCGCFEQGTTATVNGAPAPCSNGAQGLSTGCGYYQSGQFGHAEGSGSSCQVVCREGYFACCLRTHTLDH